MADEDRSHRRANRQVRWNRAVIDGLVERERAPGDGGVAGKRIRIGAGKSEGASCHLDQAATAAKHTIESSAGAVADDQIEPIEDNIAEDFELAARGDRKGLSSVNRDRKLDAIGFRKMRGLDS